MTRGAPDDEERPYGYVEVLERRGAELHVAGWLARRSGAFDEIAVETPRGTRFPASAVHRPDLAIDVPRIPHVRAAGFVAIVAAEELDRGGGRLGFALLGLERGVVVARREILWLGDAGHVEAPPPELIRRVQNHPGADLFRATGLVAAGDVARIVEAYVDATGVRRVLEFGSGCGRLTAHLARAFPSAELLAVDADREMIAWSRSHAARVAYALVSDRPPLDAPEGSFDLVVAAHVFEDGSRASQTEWAAEFERLLAPGGLVFLTTHGPHAAWFVGEREVDDALECTGFFDGIGDAALAARRPRPYHCAAFQTADATRAIWSPSFDELAHVPGGMDCFKDAWLWRRRGARVSATA